MTNDHISDAFTTCILFEEEFNGTIDMLLDSLHSSHHYYLAA